MDINYYSGEKIKEFRKKKGLNQGDVAEMLSISQSAYAKIENGHTSLDINRLFKLAEFLEVTVNDLLPKSNAQKVQFINKDGYQIEHFYADGREIIKAKDALIARLEKENEYLRAKSN